MKRANIEVGEWVVEKSTKDILKVVDYDTSEHFTRVFVELVKCNSRRYRIPRISDLRVGDVFEYKSKKYRKDGHADYWCFDDQKFVGFVQTKVRIISLAAETKEPDHRIVEVDRKSGQPIEPEKRSETFWVNCYRWGIDPCRSKKIADKFVRKNREACIPVTIEWVKGQGLDNG